MTKERKFINNKYQHLTKEKSHYVIDFEISTLETWLQEYSDLQNKELTERVKELESQLAEKENQLLISQNTVSDLIIEQHSLQRKISVFNSELTELKEKHKRDVVESIVKMVGAHSSMLYPHAQLIDIAEQYYKQKYESNENN